MDRRLTLQSSDSLKESTESSSFVKLGLEYWNARFKFKSGMQSFEDSIRQMEQLAKDTNRMNNILVQIY